MPTPKVKATAIPDTGFCIHLVRRREEQRQGWKPRTVGDYKCYWNGKVLDGLSGQMVECGGPGDNTTAIGNKHDRRIAAGTYSLIIHDGGKYKTYGYTDSELATKGPKPGLLLGGTNQRSYILIHPGQNYRWSVGCINPASGLKNADSNINYKDSRKQVINLIESMKKHLGKDFPTKAGKTIPNATIIIEKEP